MAAEPRKKGLGRGLDALMQDAPFKIDGTNAVQPPSDASKAPINSFTELEIELSHIIANPEQPRRSFDVDALSELANSIREHGVIQPIIVEKHSDTQYSIVAGERRTRAARMAGLEKIPAILREYSDQRRLEVALIENVQREDLNPIEEAEAYRSIMELGGLSQEELAGRVGKNRSTIANALRLLKLPPHMHLALCDGRLTSGHARAILSLVNPADQELLYDRIVAQGLSVRAAENQAAELAKGLRAKADKTKTAAKKELDPNLESIRQSFIQSLGTKVSIKGDLEKGQLEIEYYNMDDLQRIMDIIIGKEE